MATIDDSNLAGRLATEAGELLVTLRREAFAAGRTGKEAGAIGDRRSNELLLAALGSERPGDAVLSEEAVDDPARLDAERVWIVDPLDGTREYGLEGREDWAVHVALWERGREVTAAAVALPAAGLTLNADEPLPLRAGPARDGGPIRTVVSDSRPPGWLPALGEEVAVEIVAMGSAGAKAMAVVRGDADAYVHSGGQYEWDSAAPVGVALAHGFHASRLDGSPLRYNQENPYLPDLVICRSDLAEALLAGLRRAGAA